MDAIRTTQDWARSSLQTAVIDLRQDNTGRTVVLVGAIHVASREYYEAVNAIIAAHEAGGGVVLYEGLGSLTEEEIANLSPREKSIYRTLAPLHDLYKSFAQMLDLVFQGEAVHYDREHWINADLPLRELLRRWADSSAPLLPLDAAGATKLPLPEAPLAKSVAGFMLLQTPLLLSAATRLRGFVPQLASLSDLLISDRNRAALDALEGTDPTRAALFLYGAGHLADLMEGLERRGYREVNRRWLTAFSQRPPWAGLRDVMEGLAGNSGRR